MANQLPSRRFVLWGVALPAAATRNDAASATRLRIFTHLALLVGTAFPFLALLPDLVFLTADINDGAFHLGVARQTIEALRSGTNPIDFWVPTWLGGFPLFRYYQPAPYLLLASLQALLPSASLLVLYRIVTILAVSAVPVANYAALRWLRLPRETAGAAALLSALIAANATYGIELASFSWAGWGLFTQAVALPLLPLALAGGWRAVAEGRRSLGYACLLAATCLTHVLFGYIAALSLALIPLVRWSGGMAWRRGLNLARFAAQAGALLAFFVVPLVTDLSAHGESLYDAAEKFDSHGAVAVLTRLLGGALLDAHRLPVFTCLALAGLYRCVRRWLDDGDDVRGWLALGFVAWLLLYFGRPTWGGLIDLLPMAGGLHLERLVNAVHLFAIWLAAVALGDLWHWILRLESAALRRTLAGAAALLLAPLFGERIGYAIANAAMVADGQARFERERGELAPILAALRAEPGRVYAGHSGNWGAGYTVGPARVYQLLSAEGIEHVGHAPFSWPLTTDTQLQLQWPGRAQYRLYDVRYLLTDVDVAAPGAELVLRSGRHQLYRLPSSGPFDLVAAPLAVAADKRTARYLNGRWAASPWAPARAHLRLLQAGEDAGGGAALAMADAMHIVDRDAGTARSVFDPQLFSAAPAAPASGAIREVRQTSQAAEATIQLAEPGVALFKRTYHPGWSATIDGIPAPTMLLTPGLVGVAMPAGTHTLRLVYLAGWYKAALLLAGIALAALIDRAPRWTS